MHIDRLEFGIIIFVHSKEYLSFCLLTNHMEDLEQLNLSKNIKILFNLLELRIFDLSQTLQVASHQLSINQLKETLQKQYNIFGQVEKIFDQLKLHKLYELMKQISQNYISISSILIDEKTSTMNAKYTNLGNEKNEDKQINKQQHKINEEQKGQASRRASKRRGSIQKMKQEAILTQGQLKQCLNAVIKQSQIKLHQKLGGIQLFNQNYVRGIESMQNKWQAIEGKKKKHYNQKQLIKQLIFKEMSEQVEVQKLYDNDEISKFIKEGKIKHELYYHIEYEKDLQSISIFLKQSQDDALKFLTDTKKVSPNVENQDDIIINYHELIEILTEKKKSEFYMIEHKIKEIVQSFKIKVYYLDTQLQLNKANIRELQFQLQKRQAKEMATQTLGFRNNVNFSNTSSLEDIQEQHKAIVQLLKKNIDTTQKELLNLQTDVRVKDQKIKKKDAQISVLQTEIDKYKKNLKQEKQKTLQLTRDKFLPQNPNTIKEIQKPDDQIPQKTDQVLLHGKDIVQQEGFSKNNRRRKNKYMSGNYSTSMLSTSSKQKGRQNSVLSSGFTQVNQQSRRMNSFNTSSNQTLHHNSQLNRLSQLNQQLSIVKSDQARATDSEDVSTQRQQMTNFSSILSSQNRITVLMNQQTNGEKEDLFDTLKKIQLPNTLTNKDNTAQQYTKEIKQGEKDIQKLSITKNTQKHSKTLPQSIISGLILDKNLTSPTDPESLFSAQGLLKKNTEILYEVLFVSVQLVDGQPLVIEEEINKLKQFMGRYNQRQVQTRLRRMISFLNFSQHTQQIEQKQLCQEEDTVSDSSKRIHNQSQSVGKSPSQHQKSAINFVKESHRGGLGLRVIESRTEVDKSEKDNKPIDLEKLKEKRLKKFIPSSKFLKKIHEQIRISGKGFNLSKKEFIDMCKNITVEQSPIISQHGSISESEDQGNPLTIQKQTLFHKYKNKDVIVIVKQAHQKEQSTHHNPNDINDRILKVQGMSIHDRNREKGESQHNKQENKNVEDTHTQKQSEFPKSHKFSITKEIQHEIRSILHVMTSEKNGAEKDIGLGKNTDKKKHIKQFYTILKSQGARIQSLQKLQEILDLNKISLQDLLKITNSLKSQRPQDITNLFSHQCDHSSKIKANQKSFHIEPCCLHAKRYEAFLQKLSITEHSVRKMRKDLLDVHIFNIDGNATQKDFSKKKLTKDKSPKMIDVTNLPSCRQIIHDRTGQFDSFYIGSKKNQQKTKQKRGPQKQLIKKAAVSAYIEANQRTETQIKRETERKSVGNFNFKGSMTGFLPQLATKGMSQLIRD